MELYHGKKKRLATEVSAKISVQITGVKITALQITSSKENYRYIHHPSQLEHI
jgi:hypothetical protein